MLLLTMVPRKGPLYPGLSYQYKNTCACAYLLTVIPLSLFSPVPKRVMDGSEPSEVVAAAVLSGAPTDLQARTVR